MGSDLFLDLYTGPPWLSAAAALVSIIAFLPFSFLEYHIAKREGDLLAQRAQTRKCKTCLSLCTSPNRRLSEPDRRALIVCIFIFSSSYFCFCLFERYLIIQAMLCFINNLLHLDWQRNLPSKTWDLAKVLHPSQL